MMISGKKFYSAALAIGSSCECKCTHGQCRHYEAPASLVKNSMTMVDMFSQPIRKALLPSESKNESISSDFVKSRGAILRLEEMLHVYDPSALMTTETTLTRSGYATRTHTRQK